MWTGARAGPNFLWEIWFSAKNTPIDLGWSQVYNDSRKQPDVGFLWSLPHRRSSPGCLRFNLAFQVRIGDRANAPSGHRISLAHLPQVDAPLWFPQIGVDRIGVSGNDPRAGEGPGGAVINLVLRKGLRTTCRINC